MRWAVVGPAADEEAMLLHLVLGIVAERFLEAFLDDFDRCGIGRSAPDGGGGGIGELDGAQVEGGTDQKGLIGAGQFGWFEFGGHKCDPVGCFALIPPPIPAGHGVPALRSVGRQMRSNRFARALSP